MDVLPAIDLYDGRCVRLIQGRYDRVIAYEEDATAVAQRFASDGATGVQIVDLDGAREGRPVNLDQVRRIIESTGLRVQFGGGLRTDDDIAAALDTGVGSVVIGTRALEDWGWFEQLVRQPAFDQRIALGIDARLGKVASHGWTQDQQISALALADRVAGWPLANIVYTDISRDGLMLGPNLDAIRAMAGATPAPLIYSGGVTDLDDIRRLRELDLVAVVIGRALYEKLLDLPTAIEVARDG